MDGLSKKSAKALLKLKLANTVIEGKLKRGCTNRLELFANELAKKAFFFHKIKKEFPNLLEEYEKLFCILLGENVESYENKISANIARVLHELRNKYKWNCIRVNLFGIEPENLSDPKFLQDRDAILVVKNYQCRWIKEGVSINDSLKCYNFPDDLTPEHVIRFHYDKETLLLTFFEFNGAM